MTYSDHFWIFVFIRSFAGDSVKQVRIGQLITQVGSLTMAVAYRTKMTISTQNTHENAIMLKSDHFLKDLSPKHLRYQNHNKKKWVFITSEVLNGEMRSFIIEKKEFSAWVAAVDSAYFLFSSFFLLFHFFATQQLFILCERNKITKFGRNLWL